MSVSRSLLKVELNLPVDNAVVFIIMVFAHILVWSFGGNLNLVGGVR